MDIQESNDKVLGIETQEKYKEIISMSWFLSGKAPLNFYLKDSSPLLNSSLYGFLGAKQYTLKYSHIKKLFFKFTSPLAMWLSTLLIPPVKQFSQI